MEEKATAIVSVMANEQAQPHLVAGPNPEAKRLIPAESDLVGAAG